MNNALNTALKEAFEQVAPAPEEPTTVAPAPEEPTTVAPAPEVVPAPAPEEADREALQFELVRQLVEFEELDANLRDTVGQIATAHGGDNVAAAAAVCSALVEYFDQRLRPVYQAVVTLGEKPKAFKLTKAQKEKGESETAFHRQYKKCLNTIQHIKPIVADRLQHRIDGNSRIDFADWVAGEKKQFTATAIVAPAPAPEQKDKGEKDVSPLVQDSASPDAQAAMLEALDWEYLLEQAALAARRDDAKVSRDDFLKRAEKLFAHAVAREENAKA